MLARDLMRTEVRSVRRESELSEVIRLLVGEDAGAVPVVDDSGEIVGIITATDLLRLFLPERIQFFDIPFFLEGSRIRDEVVEQIGHLKAEQIMTHPVITVQANMPLGKVIARMLHHGIDQVPVLDGERLAGLVRRSDIVRLLVCRHVPES